MLETLPEGIVVIDDETNKVSMGNREFLKMFKCGEFNQTAYRNSEENENDHEN